MKTILQFVAAAMLVLFSSCADADYVNAIPDGCTALLSVDMAQTAKESNLGAKANVMMSLLKVSDPGDCGIDFSQKFYLFESPDGNLGMVAKVSSEKKLGQWLGKLSGSQQAEAVREHRGFRFSVINGAWMVGFSGKAVMVMGPIVAAQQTATMAQMAKYLSQDEDGGIKGTPIFEKLDSLDGGMNMVARVRALPDKVAPLFMIGAPKDADDSQVVISARMKVADGRLHVEGEPFSFNKTVNAAIKQNWQTFRPIGQNFLHGGPGQMKLWLNVDGNKFLPLLQQNKSLQSVLAGINMAIDMDNIIRSIDGDMLLSIDNVAHEMPDLGMVASLRNTNFLKDVSYWKQSCPQGSRIDDWSGPAPGSSYVFVSGRTHYYFGAFRHQHPLFFSGNSEAQARQLASLPASSAQKTAVVEGKRFAFSMDFQSIDNEALSIISQLLEPLFGKLTSIVYTVDKE